MHEAVAGKRKVLMYHQRSIHAHPLGHNVSLTNSTGITSFGAAEVAAEKHLPAAVEDGPAIARLIDGRRLRWEAMNIFAQILKLSVLQTKR